MFKSIKTQSTNLNLNSVNLIIGPNNSGKSTLLREIENSLSNRSEHHKILTETEHTNTSHEIIKILEQEGIAKIVKTNRENRINLTFTGCQVKAHTIRMIPRQIYEKTSANIILNNLTLSIYGTQRLNIITREQLGDLNAPTMGPLKSIYLHKELREEWRDEIFKAINKHVTLTPMNSGTVSISTNDRPPKDEHEELSPYTQESRSFHQNGTPIESYSDGTRAFIELATIAMASNIKILIIDEPEVFLHPPHAYKIGNLISRFAKQNNFQVFAATHSPHFILGCLQSATPLSIIRMDYKNNQTFINQLNPQDIEDLSKDPMMRNSNAIDGLFHPAAIVCEGDTDQAYYQEVNFRLNQVNEGIQDCTFLNAHSKSSIFRIVGPLRKMGVPAAAIVDFDFIKEGHDQNKILAAAGLSNSTLNMLSNIRKNLNTMLKSRNQDPKNITLEDLEKEESEIASMLIGELSKYGIFIVPVGDLEGWDKSLGVTKGRWLEKKFEQMGKDPEDENYVHPSTDGVWKFINNIAQWINNIDRKGMP